MSTTRTTTAPAPARRWRRGVAGLALTALLAAPLAACGDEEDPAPSAADQVPALATQLDRIDRALANKRYPRARDLLDRLVQQVIDAREAGDLDAAAADRILAAASRLLRELPEPKPEPTPTITVTPPSLPAPGDGGGGDDDDDDDDDKGNDDKGNDDKGNDKEKEEGKKKGEEQREKRGGGKKD